MASCTNASCVRVRFSKSLTSRRQRPSHPKVLSTIHRFATTTKPLAASERLTISRTTLPVRFAAAAVAGAAVGAIGKQALQEHEHAPHTLQKRQKALPILHIGRCHIQPEHQAQRVDDEVTLLAFDLLGRVIADRIDAPPPFSALLTLWLSTIAAVGLAWRPSSSRTCW